MNQTEEATVTEVHHQTASKVTSVGDIPTYEHWPVGRDVRAQPSTRWQPQKEARPQPSLPWQPNLYIGIGPRIRLYGSFPRRVLLPADI